MVNRAEPNLKTMTGSMEKESFGFGHHLLAGKC